MANRLKIDEKELNKKYNLRRRCIIMMDNENSYDMYITHKGGPKQRECENIAQTIIKFATKVHKIRISKLVLDFVQDQQRVTYLVGVPAFEVDNFQKIMDTFKGIDEPKSKPKLTASEIFEDKSALVYCKLCKIAFLKHEVNKIVTMKMISELRGHYNKRGIFKFDHFTKFKDTKRTCKV